MLTANLNRTIHRTQPVQRRGGAMAHRRRLISARMTVLLAGGLLLVVLLVGMVFLSNQVTALRRSIADLEDNRAFEEAQAAQLLRDWNQAAAPEVVCARAEKELGLIRPLEPETVLVVNEEPDRSRAGRWYRLMGELTGAEPALAAGHASKDRP